MPDILKIITTQATKSKCNNPTASKPRSSIALKFDDNTQIEDDERKEFGNLIVKHKIEYTQMSQGLWNHTSR